LKIRSSIKQIVCTKILGAPVRLTNVSNNNVVLSSSRISGRTNAVTIALGSQEKSQITEFSLGNVL